jgi:hypothetical protein
MEQSKKIKIIQVDLQKNLASDHTLGIFIWKQAATNNNHIYFNDEWNDEYED